MIAILLTILKIIGIILLSILGLLLLVIVLVLFVPIRYSFVGSYEEKPDALVKVSWLLHIISFRLTYTDTLEYVIRIFGIPLSAYQKLGGLFKRKRPKRQKPAKSIEKQDTNTEENTTVQNEATSETVNIDNTVNTDTINIADKTTTEDIDAEDSAEQTENWFLRTRHKIQEIFHSIKKLILRIKNGILHFGNTVEHIKSTITYYTDLLSQESTKLALASCKGRLGKIIKSIIPRKGAIKVNYGFDDPAQTANVLAVHGMLYPIVGNVIFLYPDFETPCLEVNAKGKGRIYMGVLLYQVIRIVADKNCRVFMQQLKKENAYE